MVGTKARRSTVPNKLYYALKPREKGASPVVNQVLQNSGGYSPHVNGPRQSSRCGFAGIGHCRGLSTVLGRGRCRYSAQLCRAQYQSSQANVTAMNRPNSRESSPLSQELPHRAGKLPHPQWELCWMATDTMILINMPMQEAAARF